MFGLECSNPDYCTICENGSDHCRINPSACSRFKSPGRAYRSLTLHQGICSFFGDFVDVFIEGEFVIEGDS